MAEAGVEALSLRMYQKMMVDYAQMGYVTIRVVRPELTDDFVEKMEAAGADIEYMRLEGGHGVAYAEQLEVTDPALQTFSPST